MPETIAWRPMCNELKESDTLVLIQCMKAFRISKSQALFCTLCALPTPHLMRYKLLTCSCMQCKRTAPYVTCPWRGKMLVCQERKVVSLFERGEHVTSVKPQHCPTLTIAQKDFAKQMARAGMKPARIRTAMLMHFSLQPNELPTLSQVQNVVCYYRRTKLGGSDTTASIVSVVREIAFTGSEDEHQPFSFGWDIDEKGNLVVGNGSDAKPFLVGVTTKALLRTAARDPSTFVFHVDATYKTNQVGYPVLVVGITDAARKFHLLALFVTSQQKESHYAKALAALRWIYHQILGQPLRVAFVMGDADVAQYNALATVFGGDCMYTHLMCYYHLIAKVVERTKSLPKEIGDAVLRDIYDMHYSTCRTEMVVTRDAAEQRWQGEPLLHSFLAYFRSVWLNSRFQNWQCYLTPPGYATTNNPVEQFNRALKRDFTSHRLLKMGELLQQLASCCRQRSIDIHSFALVPSASKELLARTKSLRCQFLLQEYVAPRLRISYLLLGPDTVHVLYTPPPRQYNTATNCMQETLQVSAQVGVNTARMEHKNQPETGWPLNMSTQTCPCAYHFKYAICVHRLFAMQVRDRINSNGDEVLVNRRTIKRKRSTVGPAPQTTGRPPLAGHALLRE